MGISERWRDRPGLPADLHARLAELRRVFASRRVRLAYLFGSVGRGEQAEDIDLAVLVREGSAEALWTEITRALGTDRVDLVDLATAPPVLRFEIVREGRLLHREDEDEENAFELAAIREYRDSRYRRELHDRYVAEWASG